MARHLSDRRIGHPEAARRGLRLADEAFADQRRRRETRRFGNCTHPQHGGCAAPSTTHAGDDRVDLQRLAACPAVPRAPSARPRRGSSRTRGSRRTRRPGIVREGLSRASERSRPPGRDSPRGRRSACPRAIRVAVRAAASRPYARRAARTPCAFRVGSRVPPGLRGALVRFDSIMRRGPTGRSPVAVEVL